uniref:Uncharacterized protein n=1 Tax=Ditylenchus dipsaci TaxID=166011 RepID=A0A915E4J6_9BILA
MQKRPKRSVQVASRQSYQLLPSKAAITPLGSVAKMLMKAVLDAKNKTETRPWQHTIERIKSSEKRKTREKRLEEESIENLDQLAFKGMKSHRFGQDGRDDVRVLELNRLFVTSLFSLHNQGNAVEKLTSLPNLVKDFSSKDQQEWMNLIIEAAGVVDEADRLDGELKKASEIRKESRKKFDVEIRDKNEPH